MKTLNRAERAARRKQEQRRKAMTLVLLGGALLLAVAAVLFKLNQPLPKAEIEVTGAPSLKVDQEKIEMGDIKLGKTVTASFILTNVGDQPLEIVKEPYVEALVGC